MLSEFRPQFRALWRPVEESHPDAQVCSRPVAQCGLEVRKPREKCEVGPGRKSEPKNSDVNLYIDIGTYIGTYGGFYIEAYTLIYWDLYRQYFI